MRRDDGTLADTLFSGRSTRVVGYIGVVVASGILSAALVFTGARQPTAWPMALGLIAAGIVGGFLHVDLPMGIAVKRRYDDKVRFALSDVLISAGLLLTSIVTVLVASAIANSVVSIVDGIRERQGFLKPLFNIGQHLLSLSIALLAGQQLLAEGRILDFSTLLGIGGVVLIFTTTNLLAVSGVVSLSTDTSWFMAVRRIRTEVWLVPAQTLALGVLAAVVWLAAPVATVTLAVPVLLLHAAGRQRVHARLERERTQKYVEIEQQLGKARDPQAVAEVVQEAADQFLETQVAVWADGQWFGEVPDGSQPCTVDASLSVPLVTSGRSLGPAVDGPCAAVGVGSGVLVVWTETGAMSAETVEWLERLGSSGRVHSARAAALTDLEREQATLRAVVDGTANGIAVTTGDGTVQVWNPAMAALSGVAATTAIGRVVEDVLGVGPWLEDGVHEFAYRSQERIWRVAVASTTHDLQEHLRVAVIHDVTEERRLARMKDDMLSTVSHELRTPLTPIKASAELLRRRWSHLGEEHRDEMLEQISAGATHLTRLVNDLLLVAQMSSRDGTDGLHVETIPTDVAQIVRDSAKHLAIAYPDRHVVAETPEHLYAVTDPTRLRQIVDNLGDNACKFSPPGEAVRLGVSAETNALHFSVADRGSGIALEDQERIFGRFERVENPMFMQTSGAGLGLYIVQRLIHRLGGTIDLSSAPGAGTTFHVRLPNPDPAPVTGALTQLS